MRNVHQASLEHVLQGQSAARSRSVRSVVLSVAATLAVVVGALASPSMAGAADGTSSSIPIGADVYAIAAAPDGTVYTADAGNAVTRITGAGTSAQTVTSIPVGRAPRSVAVAPDGTIYTANSDNTVTQIGDPGAADQSMTSIPLGQTPVAIAVAPDGTVYTANGNNTITRIAAPGTPNQSVSTVTAATVAGRLCAIAVGSDGTVYAAPCDYGGTAKIVRLTGSGTPDQRVTVIDTRLVNRVPSLPAIAVTPEGTVFLTYQTQAGLIQVSDPTSAAPTISTFRTTNVSYSLTAGLDGSLYQASSLNEVLRITNPASNSRVVTAAAVTSSPIDVAVTGDGTVYTANRDDTVTRLAPAAFTPRSPEFTAATPPSTATVGSAYSYTFTAGPNTSVRTTARFTLAPGDTLPAGLTLDATTGMLSGTPTTPGTTRFRLVAANTYGSATTDPITITVQPAPVAPVFTASSPAASATVGSAYSYTFTASGVPTPSFALASGDALPAGLTLDAASGELSGTPTTTGTITFRVVASNTAGTTTTDPITITVQPAVQPLETPTLTSPTAGEQITNPVTFTGTGTPGDFIALIAYPAGTPPQSSQPVDEAFAATDPVRVGADGNWTVTRTLDPGETSVFAVAFARDAAGAVTNTSAPSTVRTFTVAASASTPVGVSPSATRSPIASARPGAGELAFTGVNGAGLQVVASIAALLAAVGAGLVMIRRRRAARRR
ncbi:hypothetical protein D8M35_02310 [Curtobacterium sp. HSID17257]|nr:hypothetical protein D8M35_02310 [Curtobacterium sp. HSID17257]